MGLQVTAIDCDCNVLAKPRTSFCMAHIDHQMDSCTYLLSVHCGGCSNAAKSAHLADS